MAVYTMYKIVCNITGDTYYGHTTKTLAHRLSTHGYDLCTSRHIIDRGDYEAIELEVCHFANVHEARARERWWIKNNQCINKNLPGRTMKEWTNANKERISQKRKEEWKENTAKGKADNRRNYLKHREERCAKQKVWRDENIEVVRAKDIERGATPERKQASNESNNRCRAWARTWGGSSCNRGLNQIAVDLFD